MLAIKVACLTGVPAFADLARFNDAVALVDELGRQTTYSELAELADQFAARLGDQRRLVAIAMSNELEPIAAYLGALRAGHPVLLISPDNDLARARIFDTYAPDAVFTNDEGKWRLDRRPSRGGLHPDLALLLCTSGTTGATKLVRLSRRAVKANAASIVEYLGITRNDRAVTSLPLHYSYGLSVLNSHLQAGAGLLLTHRSIIEDEFWNFCARERATSFAGVPHTYELLDRSGLRDRLPETIRTLTQAGGRLAPERVVSLAQWAQGSGRRFFVMYGQTEASPRMAYLPPELAADHPDCIGVPIPGGSITLRGVDGEIVDSAGIVGEIVYSGENVMMGYALAREDLALGPSLESLETGDLAKQTLAGLYKIVGRKSRFVKPFGLRVSLDEIETELLSAGIAAMVAGDDELIAIACCEGPKPSAVIEHLIARYELPDRLFDVCPVPDLPRVPSGKPDYQHILKAARARRGQMQDLTSSPGFAGLFSKLLNRPDVSPHDSFVSLDGDSLSYVNVVTEIDRQIGSVPDNWESLSVFQLDTLVDRTSARRRPWFRSYDSEIVLRALAIMGVVLTHARFRVAAGGSDALFMLAGYNLARFNREKLWSGRGWSVVLNFGQRVILPYYAILLVYAAFDENPGIYSFLLVDNFVLFPKRFDRFLTPYWFIEALLHATVIMAMLFTLKPVRSFAQRRPVAFGLSLLVVAITVRIAAFEMLHHVWLRNYSTDAVLPLFALGWLMYFARSVALKVTCVAWALLLGLANSSVLHSDLLVGGWPLTIGLGRMVWIVAGAMLVLFVRRLWLLRPVGSVLTSIAAISFTIYLVHMVPVHLLARVGHFSPAITLLGTLLFAFSTAWALKLLRHAKGVARTRAMIIDWLRTLWVEFGSIRARSGTHDALAQ